MRLTFKLSVFEIAVRSLIPFLQTNLSLLCRRIILHSLAQIQVGRLFAVLLLAARVVRDVFQWTRHSAGVRLSAWILLLRSIWYTTFESQL